MPCRIRAALLAAALGALVAALTAAPRTTAAGVRLEVADDIAVTFGLRVQTYARVLLPTDDDPQLSFVLRRARFRFGVQATEWAEAFAQTDVGSDGGGAGVDVRLVDAHITFKPHRFAWITAGQQQTPSSRQTLTSSAALLAIDRPALNNKSLSWGVRGRAAFSTETPDALASALAPSTSPRDQGVTLTGHASVSERVHLKWNLGVYDGRHAPGHHVPRVTGRLQLNLFDAEPKYFQKSTYLGTKRTVALGVSYDWQGAAVATAPAGGGAGDADYHYLSGELFLDWPVGPGALTVEAGGSWLRFEGDAALDVDADPATPALAAGQVEGFGAYAQAGWYIAGWQPWVGWERWFADVDAGSYQLVRAGVTWFPDGHRLNVKLGYEYFLADRPILDGGADTLHTVLLAAFFDY